MKYSLKELSKTEIYQNNASAHAKAMIFISVMTLIISGFLSDVEIGFVKASIVLIGWCLFGTSILIAFPSFIAICWTAIKQMELDDIGKPSLRYAILKKVIECSAIALSILSTLFLLGRL